LTFPTPRGLRRENPRDHANCRPSKTRPDLPCPAHGERASASPKPSASTGCLRGGVCPSSQYHRCHAMFYALDVPRSSSTLPLIQTLAFPWASSGHAAAHWPCQPPGAASSRRACSPTADGQLWKAGRGTALPVVIGPRAPPAHAALKCSICPTGTVHTTNSGR
jgi:hypothetical protein